MAKYTLKLVNDTNIASQVQVRHAGARVFHAQLPSGQSVEFEPGINRNNFTAIFRFDNDGAPKKLKKKGISLKESNQTVTCTGEAFALKKR